MDRVGPPAHREDPARLGPDRRREALRRLRHDVFDMVVVGGGVTGCGIALDAATRGLSVALVEMRDYAAGTSSRSGKLIHGGLRYLEQLNFPLVREALRERGLMLRRLCPHLVTPVRFVYPLRHRGWERPYVGSGTLLYDTLGGAGAVPRHRHLTRGGARRLAPALRADGLRSRWRARPVEYLLREANRVLDPPLDHADVVGVFAGLRPLLSGVEAERASQQQPDDASADAARRGVRDPRLLAGE